MATGRPEGAGDADTVVRQRHRGLPVAQQVVQHRVEGLLGRIPGLHQIVVQPNGVDALDGRFGVGVGGEQHFARLGIELARLGQELGAIHGWHALVGQKQGDGRIASFELARGFQRLGPRGGLDDSIVAAIVPAQIALDGIEHLRFVIYRENDGLGHGNTSGFRSRVASSRRVVAPQSGSGPVARSRRSCPGVSAQRCYG